MAEHACIPVISALSEREHPCQALADYFTLHERFGDLKNITLAYVGDGNNFARPLLLTCSALGAKIRIATPLGYGPNLQIVADAHETASRTRAKIEILTDPHEAVFGVDAVYTDAWTSMGHEHESEERDRIFPPFQMNRELVAEAAPHAWLFHCIPCHRGLNINEEGMYLVRLCA